MALLLILSFQQKQANAEERDISLTDLTPFENSSYFYENKWYSNSFADVNNNLIVNGLGFTSKSGYASYNIHKEGYKSFKASITLDSKQLTGDYGNTAIGFYADDVLLYEKQLSKKSGIVDVNVALPEKAENFYIIVKQTEGAKGTHLVVVANPVFSTSGKYSNTGELPVSPLTIGASESSSYVYANKWYNEVFQDINENIITSGIGLYSSGSGTGYATYNIEDMGYNQFVAKVSLDSKWSVGNFGQSSFAVYADDYLLYEKELTTKTPVQSVKLSIPKGTKNITLITKQIEGAKGTHNVVLNNPLFKKTSGKLVVVPKTIAFTSVGAIESSSYYYQNNWYSNPFQYSNGKIASSGVGLYKDGGYARYNIANMGFNSLKTTLSLDSKWINGDYGTSSAYIYADNKLLYSTKLKKTDVKNLTVRFPKNTKNVEIYIQQKSGAKGEHNVVFGNARFTNLPVSSKPSASKVSITNNKNKSDAIVVKSLSKKDVVIAYDAKGKQIASGTASKTSVTLKVKQLGKKKGKIYITRTNSGKLISDKTSVPFKAEK